MRKKKGVLASIICMFMILIQCLTAFADGEQTGNTEVHATFKQFDVTLKYVLQESPDKKLKADETITVDYGQELDLTSKSNINGYTCVVWKDNNGISYSENSDGKIIVPKGKTGQGNITTLTGYFIEGNPDKSLRVDFEVPDFCEEVASRGVSYGDLLSDPGMPLLKAGNVSMSEYWRCWRIKNTNTEWNFDDPVLSSMTLVAVFEGYDKKWRVDFNINYDGSTSIPATIVENKEICSTYPSTSRKGYLLVDWNTEKDADPSKIEDYAATSVKNLPITEDTTFYAIWKPARDGYHIVHFDTNGGNYINDREVEDGRTVAQPEDPEKEGYIFETWHKDSASGYVWDFTTPITEELWLVASWAPGDGHWVTFDAGEGSLNSPEKVFVATGGKVSKPADPTPVTGMYFWSWRKQGESKYYNFNKVVTENMTLVARYEDHPPTTYPVTFDVNGGNEIIPNVQYVVEEDHIIDPGDPTHPNGYDFFYWSYKGVRFDFEDDDQNTVTQAMTLIAEWDAAINPELQKYKVHFIYGKAKDPEGNTEKIYASDGEQAIIFPSITPDNSSWTFWRWIEWDEDGDNVVTATEASSEYTTLVGLHYTIHSSPEVFTKDTIIQAIWKDSNGKIIWQYPVADFWDDLSLVASLEVDHDTFYLPYLPTVTRDGSIFRQWVSSEGTVATLNTAYKENKVFNAQWENDDKYIVYFDYEGGTDDDGNSNKTVHTDGKDDVVFPEITNPPKSGWNFKEWIEYCKDGDKEITKENCYFQPHLIGSKYKVHTSPEKFTKNTLVQAVWFDENGNIIWPEKKVVFVDEGEVYCTRPLNSDGTVNNIPELSKDGYKFNGWDFDDGSKLYSNTIVDPGTFFYSDWIESDDPDGPIDWNVYAAIYFDANGGLLSNGERYTTKYVKKGMTAKSITVPTPVWEGHEFSGWFHSDTLKEFDQSAVITMNIALIAAWDGKLTPPSPSVIDLDDAFGHNYYIAVNDDLTITIPDGIYDYGKAHGYEFIGWYYPDGSQWSEGDKFSYNTILVAKWKKKSESEVLPKYTVSFNSAGGSKVASQKVEYGSRAYKPSNPKKSGYIFGGWYLGTAAYSFDAQIIENITLTAHWTVNNSIEAYHTVTFVTDSTNEVTPMRVLSGNKIVKPYVERDGYEVSYWYTDSKKTKPWSFTSSVNKDMTLYAKWTKSKKDKKKKKNDSKSESTLNSWADANRITAADSEGSGPVNPGQASDTVSGNENVKTGDARNTLPAIILLIITLGSLSVILIRKMLKNRKSR